MKKKLRDIKVAGKNYKWKTSINYVKIWDENKSVIIEEKIYNFPITPSVISDVIKEYLIKNKKMSKEDAFLEMI